MVDAGGWAGRNGTSKPGDRSQDGDFFVTLGGEGET